MPSIQLTADQLEPHIGTRLDAFLAAHLERSRGHAQELIKAGAVTVNPARASLEASSKIRSGDSISIELAEQQDSSLIEENAPQPEAIPLEIVYEDEFLVVINKQPGLVVHPAAGHASGTLVNALLHHCGAKLAGRGGTDRLGIVHRLDKDTSGLLIVAKSDLVHERLSKDFAQRNVSKMYRALAWGRFRRTSGQCLGAIGRNPKDRKKMAVLALGGRPSRTDYRVISQGAFGAEVECDLHTGRTHQIRVHLAQLGHPIWGDTLYGKPHVLQGYKPARQMLHAYSLKFTHPITQKKMDLVAPFPEDFCLARKVLCTQ